MASFGPKVRHLCCCAAIDSVSCSQRRREERRVEDILAASDLVEGSGHSGWGINDVGSLLTIAGEQGGRRRSWIGGDRDDLDVEGEWWHRAPLGEGAE